MKIALKLGLVALAIVCMAPNRRAHDHIGNFNFTVEISGVAAGQFQSAVGLAPVLDAADTRDVVTDPVKFTQGQASRAARASQGQVVVHFTLVEPAPGLPDGYTCTLAFPGRVLRSSAGSLTVKPTDAARSNCR